MARAFVTGGVFVEIELVVILCVPPLLGGEDLGDDLAVPPLIIGFLCDLPRDGFLLGGVVEYPAPVLGSLVGTLLVRGGGIMHAVEEFEELGIRYFGGVVD